MNKYNKLMLVAGGAMLFASPALAASQTSATETVTTRAQIVEPLVLSNPTNLDFGTLVKAPGLTATPVAVVLKNAGGLVSCPAGLLCSGAQVAATFKVAGTPNQSLFVTTSASVMSNGTDNLAFTPNPVTGVALDNLGVTSFGVGGSINVSTATPAGVYNGTMDVTVDYN